MSSVTLNPELVAILAAPGITTQLEACAAFKNAFGSSRRVTVTHNGVQIRNCALTGAMQSIAGSITGFGIASGDTAAGGANLNAGSAVLHISGGGHYVEGSLGLPGSGATFIIDSNPTPTNGLALVEINIPLRQDLPLGGPGTGVPYRIAHVDWSTGSAGEVQSVVFDAPQPDIIREDGERLAETGAIPYAQCGQTIVAGTGGYAFEFGFHRYTLPPQCNDEDPTKPVYEVQWFEKPYQRWPGYPFMAGYDKTTDSTYPLPHKIHIYDVYNNELGVHEHRDDLPVNSPQLKQTRNLVDALEPHVHCKMAGYWCSHQLKLSANARRWFNGTVPGSSNRPKQAREKASTNAVIPLLDTMGGQVNGYLHWLYAPPDPLNATDQYPVTDPNAVAGMHSNDATVGARNAMWASGYLITGRPGALGTHDWFTPPGGNRFDRYPVPSQIAAYLTEPSGVRPQGFVPYKQLSMEYCRGYFHLAHHDVMNVRTAEGIPHDQVAYGKTAYCYGYYTSQGPIFVPGGEATHINWFITGNGTNYTDTPQYRDRDGKLPYGGSEIDIQHAYAHPFWYALLYNSVAAEMSAKFRYGAVMMSNGGSGSPTSGFTGDYGILMRRSHAWRWFNQLAMWKIGNNHSAFLSRTQSVPRLVAELEFFHDTVVEPATNPSNPAYNSMEFTCLRNLGMTGLIVSDGAQQWAKQMDDAKLFYLAGVFAIAKSTGALDFYRAQSVKCQKALNTVLGWVHNYTINQMLATRGRRLSWTSESGGADGQYSPKVPMGQQVVPYASWQAWADALAPVNGQSDLVTNPDGTIYQKEKQQYQHLWVQAIFMFRDFFGDENFPGVTQACGIAQAMEDKFAAAVAAGQTQDFTYRHHAAGIWAKTLA